MEDTRQLVLLSVGLCLVFHYVHAVDVRVFGSSPFNTNKDLSGWLARLKSRQAELEADVAHSRGDIWSSQMELQGVKASIAQLEATLRVPYKDYLASLSGQREEFEREKAQLRAKLAEAENKRLQAADDLTLEERKKGAEVPTYTAALTKATTERNKIANEYAKFTEAYYQQEAKMKKERDRFLAEKRKLQETLDGTKKKYSQVFEALSATPTDGYKPIRIPEQAEINKLREDITAFHGMADRKKLKKGLGTTKTKLQKLLNRLYETGKFSSNTSRGDIESALREMEKITIVTREERENQREGFVEKMKNEDLINHDDGEIASLKKTNEDMAASDVVQKEIARRGAYLKGIEEVSDLIKECSNAIRDANERNLANIWAEAIQEAADSPLAKLWAQSLQEAKDSDLAKAWAHAIQDAKNSKLAKMWTNAIHEAKDINLADVWHEALQNIKGSSLARMWSDVIKNAKDSPFTKECAHAFEGAKNSFCEVLKLVYNKNLK